MFDKSMIVIICHVIAAICFGIAGIGNIEHGNRVVGIALVVCTLLQVVVGIINYFRFKNLH